MNTPHKYAEVIKAWADGYDIQFRQVGELYDNNWIYVVFPFQPNFNDPKLEWRIKPKTIKYRVALNYDNYAENYYLSMVNNKDIEQEIMNSRTFIRWVTEWTEVTINQ